MHLVCIIWLSLTNLEENRSKKSIGTNYIKKFSIQDIRKSFSIERQISRRKPDSVEYFKSDNKGRILHQPICSKNKFLILNTDYAHPSRCLKYLLSPCGLEEIGRSSDYYVIDPNDVVNFTNRA
jgi:hypothetical protein